MQALHHHERINSVDYLSTVSGGGYIGSCLSAAMSIRGGGLFAFGTDVSDSPAVAHLRNYSNYLLPRGRSSIRNVAEAVAIILRGLLANIIVVFSTLLFCALVTQIAYPNSVSLGTGSFVPRLLDGVFLQHGSGYLNGVFGAFPFSLTLWTLAVAAVVLIIWAVLRSFPWLDVFTGDTQSWVLFAARVLIVATVIVTFLDLQPLAIGLLTHVHDNLAAERERAFTQIHVWFGALIAFSGVISVLSSSLGHFLKTSQRATDWKTLALRGATHFAVLLASMVLPIALWIGYLYLSAWTINEWAIPIPVGSLWLHVWQIYLVAFAILTVIALSLRANAYSLHRFYRDRLSKAFVFDARRWHGAEPVSLDSLRLSDLANSAGPYHIINTAMNVQGSAEANRRGRNADFFMFTRDFIGSDLTLYGPTKETLAATPDMEIIDLRLDLPTAMAISGAAVSANMGANTVRLLSPTLALLNIRLGYWLRNPRDLARAPNVWRILRDSISWVSDKFYLLMEMLNLLDETRRNVYLSDGGHIENLGVYELLKRGCQTIVVVDAEADPSMSFGSLLKLERYARIDLGVRIALPWESIARMTKFVSEGMERGDSVRSDGPHCAIGRIFYENGAEGIIVYFKSSLTGDEKDYILDYKKRYLAFPHETTGDQFFSEEQFEVYRALGFHMVDGFFNGRHDFAWLSDGPDAFADRATAFADVAAMLPAIP